MEHKAGPDIIHELAMNLYPSSFESFREALSNAFDEGSKRVEIKTSMKEVIVEDWGEGVKDVDKFIMFGQYSKAELGGEIIGKKGLGKLALFRLGDVVEFRTNNGEFGIDIMMDMKILNVNYGGTSKYLPHQGTQIFIPSPRDVPPIDELSQYVKKVFGLRIAKGAELILNGVPLTSNVDSSERFLCRLHGRIDVTGNLKEDRRGHGSVDVYVRHVFVCSVAIDPERMFNGWVNCNDLEPTTSRNDLVKNDTYDDFLNHMKQNVCRFRRREEELSRDEIQLGNEMASLLQRYLSRMKLIPKGPLPIRKGPIREKDGRVKPKGKEPKEPSHEEPSDYEKQHTSTKTNKPIKRVVKTTYGIKWIDQDVGNEQEPIFFIEPNLVVRNRTNDLYKFAKSKTNMGPKWFRLLPYLSRVAVTIDPKSKDLGRKEFNLEVDKATRAFLQLKGEIS